MKLDLSRTLNKEFRSNCSCENSVTFVRQNILCRGNLIWCFKNEVRQNQKQFWSLDLLEKYASLLDHRKSPVLYTEHANLKSQRLESYSLVKIYPQKSFTRDKFCNILGKL